MKGKNLFIVLKRIEYFVNNITIASTMKIPREVTPLNITL